MLFVAHVAIKEATELRHLWLHVWAGLYNVWRTQDIRLGFGLG